MFSTPCQRFPRCKASLPPLSSSLWNEPFIERNSMRRTFQAVLPGSPLFSCPFRNATTYKNALACKATIVEPPWGVLSLISHEEDLVNERDSRGILGDCHGTSSLFLTRASSQSESSRVRTREAHVCGADEWENRNSADDASQQFVLSVFSHL